MSVTSKPPSSSRKPSSSSSIPGWNRLPPRDVAEGALLLWKLFIDAGTEAAVELLYALRFLLFGILAGGCGGCG